MADQTINVTGTVPPQASDFQTALATDTDHTIPENSVVTYTVTYGSHLDYTDQLTIEASWGQGTINGTSNPSVSEMDYVTGSASHAYNSTSPVVDLVNHKLDWTIAAFPSQTTNQTVTFQLRTNMAYTGDQSVTFPIQVKLITPHFTTASQSVTTTYLFDPGLVNPPTPTSPPGPTATPAPQPSVTTVTPTATPIQSPTPSPTSSSAFSDITIFNLTSDTGQISFIVKQPGTVTLLYGTSPTNLGNPQTVTTSGSGIVNLPKLLPKTQYYFQLISTGSNGTYYSEVFSLLTPTPAQVAKVALPSFIISSENDILYSPTQTANTSGTLTNPSSQLPTVPVASTTSYTLSFKLTKFQDIKTVQILLEHISPLSVLGFPTFAQAQGPVMYTYTAFNKGNGLYSANITDNLPPGIYNAAIRIIDTTGNITTQQVANMHVLHPFITLDSKTKKPIADIRITLYRYDLQSKKYVLFPTTNGFENPIYTNTNGQASEQLPPGNYQAQYTHIGHKPKTIAFSIGSSPTDDYPTAYIEKAPITPQAVIDYYQNAFSDWLGITLPYLAQLKETYRYYNLFGLISLFCLVILTLMFFSLKTHIALTKIHMYFHHHLLKHVIKESPYVSGQIIDTTTHQPLTGVSISLVDEARRILYQTSSNKKGGFLVPSKLASKHMLLVVKNGYEETLHHTDEDNMIISLTPNNTLLKSDFFMLWHMLETFFSAGFAFLLIASLLFEIILVPTFGISQTAIFLLISLSNLILWVFYEQEKHTATL